MYRGKPHAQKWIFQWFRHSKIKIFPLYLDNGAASGGCWTTEFLFSRGHTRIATALRKFGSTDTKIDRLLGSLVMFQFCRIIGISKIKFFNFSGTERIKSNTNINKYITLNTNKKIKTILDLLSLQVISFNKDWIFSFLLKI